MTRFVKQKQCHSYVKQSQKFKRLCNYYVLSPNCSFDMLYVFDHFERV